MIQNFDLETFNFDDVETQYVGVPEGRAVLEDKDSRELATRIIENRKGAPFSKDHFGNLGFIYIKGINHGGKVIRKNDKIP